MIIDCIQNAHLYLGLGYHLDNAMKFIQNTDLNSVKSVVLNDGTISVGRIDYITKPLEQCKKEIHKVNADIHICLSGTEVFGYCCIKNAIPITEYDPKTDKQFFNAQMNYTRLFPGMFAIAFPDDVHSAMMADTEATAASKILIKCRL